MNRKKCTLIICALCLLILISTSIFSCSIGQCVVTGNNTLVLVQNHGNIISLTTNTPVNVWPHKHKTGDKILVLHGGVQETFPSEATAFFCVRLKRGSIHDISDDLQQELQLYGILP